MQDCYNNPATWIGSYLITVPGYKIDLVFNKLYFFSSLQSSTVENEYEDTFQLITCEEHGKIIIWTVIDSVRDSDVHLGLAHWGCVRIVSSVQMEVSWCI